MTVELKSVWFTSDKQHFPTREEAERHEEIQNLVKFICRVSGINRDVATELADKLTTHFDMFKKTE